MDGVGSEVVGGGYGRVAGVVDGTYQRSEREHVASGRRVGGRLQLDLGSHVVELRLRQTRLPRRPRHRREPQLLTTTTVSRQVCVTLSRDELLTSCGVYTYTPPSQL